MKHLKYRRDNEVQKCQKCGRYMSGYMEHLFGGTRMVWICPCGYSTKQSGTGMTYNNITENTGGISTDRIIFHR